MLLRLLSEYCSLFKMGMEWGYDTCRIEEYQHRTGIKEVCAETAEIYYDDGFNDCLFDKGYDCGSQAAVNSSAYNTGYLAGIE